jgi:hypothetical protein
MPAEPVDSRNSSAEFGNWGARSGVGDTYFGVAKRRKLGANGHERAGVECLRLPFSRGNEQASTAVL